jgi:hypothetical protein
LPERHYFPSLEKRKQISKEEEEDFEDELIQLCHYKFLAGQDVKYFNYQEIDNSE